MVRALDTTNATLPGVSTPRLVGRLAALFAITLAGALVCGSMLAQTFTGKGPPLWLLTDPFALYVASPMIGIGWLFASAIALVLLPSRYCLRSALAVCAVCVLECLLLASVQSSLGLVAVLLTIPVGCVWLSRFGRDVARAAP